MKKVRDIKGITLIALVVTIIVLLILAGIVMNLTIGNNGLFTRATTATLEHTHGVVKEAVTMKLFEYSERRVANEDVDSNVQELTNEGIIGTSEIVDVQKLTGAKQRYGNGSGRKDVYTIEDNYLYYYNDKEEVRELMQLGEDEKTKPEPMEPTAVYAKTYQDGTLILSSTDYTDESRIIYEDYGDISKKKYDVYDVEFQRGDFPGWMKLEGFERVIIHDVIAPTTMCAWFYNMKNVTEIDLSNVNTCNVKDMSYMFMECNALKKVIWGTIDTSNVENMSGMFRDCYNLSEVKLGAFDTSKVTNMSSMFENCYGLEKLNVSSFDTSKVTDMEAMFSDLEVQVLDVSNFKTENVEYMGGMFRGCYKIKELDLSNFNTEKVKSMVNMFSQCSGLTSVDVSSFDTSQVKNMQAMFGYCNSLTNLDVSNFRTEQVESMQAMFEECKVLENLDVSNFDTSKVTNMNAMFESCNNLKQLDVSGFNTSNVTDMFGIFADCESLELLDVSGFDFGSISSNSNMNKMFKNCPAIIYVKDQEMIDLFNTCYAGDSNYQIKNS